MTAMRIFLLGAGHAHLDVIRRAGRIVRRGHAVTVVSPGGSFWYSGLATGMLGGQYAPADDAVDVARLCERVGAGYVDAAATGLDRTAKVVRLDGGRSQVGYDVLSLDVGSVVRPLPGQPADNDESVAAGVYSIKPIENLARLRHALDARRDAGRPTRVVIAGGGYSGCEIAANLAGRGVAGDGGSVALVAAGPRLLDDLPAGGQADALADDLRRRGVRVVTGNRVERIDPAGTAVLGDDSRLPFDVLVNATGLHPPPVLRSFGLPLDDTGAVIVDDHLRSVGDPSIFGGGDCISFGGRPLPRNGVFAVRQAKALSHNLSAAAEGRPLKTYRPQRKYLLVLNLADGTGLAVRGGLAHRGRVALWLKRWLDRRYLRQFGDAASRSPTIRP